MSVLRMTLGLALVAPFAGAQRADSPAAVKRYFYLVRPVFSGRTRTIKSRSWTSISAGPATPGFNASIRRVEETLKAAGYVEESRPNRRRR